MTAITNWGEFRALLGGGAIRAGLTSVARKLEKVPADTKLLGWGMDRRTAVVALPSSGVTGVRAFSFLAGAGRLGAWEMARFSSLHGRFGSRAEIWAFPIKVSTAEEVQELASVIYSYTGNLLAQGMPLQVPQGRNVEDAMGKLVAEIEVLTGSLECKLQPCCCVQGGVPVPRVLSPIEVETIRKQIASVSLSSVDSSERLLGYFQCANGSILCRQGRAGGYNKSPVDLVLADDALAAIDLARRGAGYAWHSHRQSLMHWRCCRFTSEIGAVSTVVERLQARALEKRLGVGDMEADRSNQIRMFFNSREVGTMEFTLKEGGQQ